MPIYTRRTVLAVAGAVGSSTVLRGLAFASGSRPYYQGVLGKNPVAYWRLNERTGLAAHDASGHGRAGTYQGGVVLGQPGAVHGDTCVGLNGSGAFVNVPDSSVFSQPTSSRGLTVEAWMRPDALTFAGETDQQYIHWLGKGQAGEFEWGFRFYSDDSPSRPNRISAYIWNPTSTPGNSNEGAGAYFQDTLTRGQWMHIVACFDPGDASDPAAGVSIYKNGVLRESPRKSKAARYASYGVQPVHGNAPVRLGTRDLKSYLTGSLDDVAIYPRVLSASEILDNYMGAS